MAVKLIWKRAPDPKDDESFSYVSECGRFRIERLVEYGIGRDRVSFDPVDLRRGKPQSLLSGNFGVSLKSAKSICEGAL